MSSSITGRSCAILAAGLALAIGAPVVAAPQNFFENPGFESGNTGYHISKASGTDGKFEVDRGEAAEGTRSALVTIGKISEWGVQLGQSFDGGQKGKTYTFAAVVKATKADIPVRLEIERNAKPWDRAVASEKTTVKKGDWTEIHVTFQVKGDWPEGWFAYVSCNQADTEFRVDMMRLYEGEFIPFDKVPKEAPAAGTGVALFDTGASAAAPLAGEAVAKKDGWTPVAEGQTPKLKGDAVLANGRVALVLRRGAAGAELYAVGPKATVLRATLAPVGAAGMKVDAVAVAKAGGAEGGLDATFKAAEGKAATGRYELTAGQVFVKAEARDGAKALAIEAPARYVLMPDFFTDDIVVDATELKGAVAELPSENLLVHLVGDGESVVVAVTADRGEDMRITLAGEGKDRVAARSEIPYGKGAKTWVGVIESPDVWHRRDVTKDEIEKVVPVGWKMPFPAQWRVDWRRGGVTDSWDLVLQRREGDFEKPGWFSGSDRVPADRKRWTTVLGSFRYPCWVEKDGQAYFQPLKREPAFDGPTILYPLNRVKATPLDVFTVADIMRGTLGVGPCEYVLDLEGQSTWYKGRATCGTRDLLRGIYSAKQQKAKRAEVEKGLDDVVIFVKAMRARIEQYVDWSHKVLAYLDEQKKAHPELSAFIADMETQTKVIEANVERRKAEIKTPQYVVDLTEKFRKELLDDESDGAMPKVKDITEKIVGVGGNQDELVGESRLAVKVLRQKAALGMAADPKAGEIAKEIRKRSQEILRNPSSYESPRH